jgi:deoxyribose-phosphate aldolase
VVIHTYTLVSSVHRLCQNCNICKIYSYCICNTYITVIRVCVRLFNRLTRKSVGINDL